MVAAQKFQDLVEQILTAKHDFTAAGHVMKLALVNSPAPVVTNTIFGDLTEITAENGYTAGGDDVGNDLAEAAGVATVQGDEIVWTASTGTIGPFRYVVLYNDTQATPAKPLVVFYDYGSNITLQDGETFTVTFDSTDPGDIFTLT